MTWKNKMILLFLSIMTLGIYPFLLFKKKNKTYNQTLSEVDKTIVDIEKLRDLLGGTTNIFGTEYTHTKTKIFIKDSKKVNIELIQKMKGISGVVLSSNAIKIIVGNSAKLIAQNI